MNKSERIIVVDRGVPDAPDGPCHKFNHAIYSTAPELSLIQHLTLPTRAIV